MINKITPYIKRGKTKRYSIKKSLYYEDKDKLPIIERNGKYYFICNGKEIDITYWVEEIRQETLKQVEELIVLYFDVCMSGRRVPRKEELLVKLNKLKQNKESAE